MSTDTSAQRCESGFLYIYWIHKDVCAEIVIYIYIYIYIYIEDRESRLVSLCLVVFEDPARRRPRSWWGSSSSGSSQLSVETSEKDSHTLPSTGSVGVMFSLTVRISFSTYVFSSKRKKLSDVYIYIYIYTKVFLGCCGRKAFIWKGCEFYNRSPYVYWMSCAK